MPDVQGLQIHELVVLGRAPITGDDFAVDAAGITRRVDFGLMKQAVVSGVNQATVSVNGTTLVIRTQPAQT